MTRAELLADIEAILLDPTFTDAMLLKDMDAALLDSARVVRAPGLLASATVTLSPAQSSVALPDDYHHDLFEVVVDDQPVIICSNTKELLYQRDLWPLVVAAENGALHYLPAPKVDIVASLRYYRKPESFAYDQDAHEWIPDELHWPLIGGYVLARRYPFLEDGVSTDRNSTAFYQATYADALAKLHLAFPETPKFTPVRRRTVRWF